MKTRTLAAALACLCTLSAPALALDLSLGAALGGSASASSGESAGLSLGLGAAVGAKVDLGPGDISSEDSMGNSLSANASAAASLTSNDDLSVVIALIESSHWTGDSFASLTDIDAVGYDVRGWIDAGNAARFDLALADNAGEIDDLQLALASNVALEAWLAANHHSAEDVIAVGVAADGSLAVFTD